MDMALYKAAAEHFELQKRAVFGEWTSEEKETESSLAWACISL
jgi:hypothetical protein